MVILCHSNLKNIANPEKHFETTAEEIYSELSDIDVFIAGVGTGGTVTGVEESLRKK